MLSCTGTEVTIDYDKCTNCGRCVKSCPTDAWEGKSGYIVSFGGLFGNHIYKGEQLLPLITDEETLFRVTDAAIGFFEEHANPGERFRLLLQRVGEDEFRSCWKQKKKKSEWKFKIKIIIRGDIRWKSKESELMTQ